MVILYKESKHKQAQFGILLSCSEDDTVDKVWDIETGVCLKNFKIEGTNILSVF